MTQSPPEFSRPVRVDTIGSAPRTLSVAAEAEERRRLAGRFGLLEVLQLEADATLVAEAAGIRAEGWMRGAVVQSCVATGEPIPASVEARFRLLFAPADTLGADDEIELSEQDCDTIPYEGGVIDLGEAVAETLALELDPFPRLPDADQRLREAGVVGEEEVGAFSALSALRAKLGGDA